MILITGASGLLGATLTVAAQRRHESVIAVCRNHRFSWPGVQIVSLDLTDDQALSELMYRFRPSWIINCAAITDVDWCEAHAELAYLVNTKLPYDLAVASRSIGARLIQISTDAVFNGEAALYDETDTPAPLNVYARSKLEGEEAVQSEAEHWLVIRTNIFGWNMQNKLSLAEWVLNKLESGSPVPGFRDVVFNPILTNDLSDIILDMMDLNLHGLFHVAGGRALSKYEFATELARVFGLDPQLVKPVSIAESTLTAPRPKNTSLDTGKIGQALGRKMPEIRCGLRRFKELRDSGAAQALKAAIVEARG